MKKTAVEYLFEQLWKRDKNKLTWNALLEQAKIIEKGQMKDATLYNATKHKQFRKIIETQFEQYYKETYGE